MADTTRRDTWVNFRIDGIPDSAIVVLSMHGYEELSRLFEFNIVLQTTGGSALSFDAVDATMNAKCFISFGPEDEHKIHGVVREIEALPVADTGDAQYRLKFVPKVFDLTMIQGSWVYQELNIPDIIKDVLTEAGFSEGHDFEFRLTQTYKPWEYKVQYEETDYNFVSRLAEYAGIFFFFEHTDEESKIVFTDANEAFKVTEGYERVPFDDRGGEVSGRASVQAISRVVRKVPKKFRINDYNYRAPSVGLVSERDVDGEGVGAIALYGEHHKTPEDGKRLVRLRAQELQVQKVTCPGRSHVSCLRAGMKFTLEGHPVEAYDAEYVVTSVTHSVVQSAVVGQTSQDDQAYFNEFRLIPSGVPYRAARVTPVPKIFGVMHARIDATSDGVHDAPIDEQGRYKVLLPFDVAGKPGGRASRWCRAIQVTAGGGFGMHFPLHQGTEVLLIHLGGDPDRPVIAGSVANAETPSPVTSANANQSSLATRHGISIVMTDG
jgi:type VI secretion system secreted protein VgrG